MNVLDSSLTPDERALVRAYRALPPGVWRECLVEHAECLARRRGERHVDASRLRLVVDGGHPKTTSTRA